MNPKYIFFLLFSFLPIKFVSAQERLPVSNDNNSFITTFKILFYLSFILIIIFLFFRILASKSGFIKPNFYRNLGGVPLGQNKSLQVVEIGNKIYILGVGENIQLIEVVEGEENILAIKRSITNDNKANNSFIEILMGFKLVKRLQNMRVNKSDGNQFDNLLTEKLEQLKERRVQAVSKWFEEQPEKNEKSDQHV